MTSRPWVLLAALVLATPAAGQIPLPTPPVPTGDPRDTIRVDPFRIPPPISPGSALLRSILLPGWGQAALHRRSTGAFFVMWEGISLTMTLKSVHQLDFLEAVASEDDPDSMERVEAKRQEIQDWAILLAFNHLVAGAEAFVSAYLWDFPEQIDVSAYSGDGVGIRVSVALP